jgi:hypothetical protein
MKLIFLIILLCGITTTPNRTVNLAKAKKACTSNVNTTTAKATTVKPTSVAIDMVPSGLLFQF